MGLPRWLSGEESTCHTGGLGSILGSNRSPGKGNGYPLQYSCLGNSMHRLPEESGRPWSHKESDMT